MHASLDRKNNLFLVALWAVGVAAVAYTSASPPWMVLGAGAPFGLVAGTAQAAAMRAAPGAFLASETAAGVRRALSATRAGRLSIHVLWLSALILFASAYWIDSGRALIGWMAGYASFGLTKELMTLPGTFRLRRIEREGPLAASQ